MSVGRPPAFHLANTVLFFFFLTKISLGFRLIIVLRWVVGLGPAGLCMPGEGQAKVEICADIR